MIAESDTYDKPPYRTHVECYVILFYTDPPTSFDISTFGLFDIRFIFHMTFNPLLHMPSLGSSNAAAHKDMMRRPPPPPLPFNDVFYS